MKKSGKNMIKLTIVILIITIIVLVGIIIKISKTNNTIDKQEKNREQQLTETTANNAYITVEEHMSELNSYAETNALSPEVVYSKSHKSDGTLSGSYTIEENGTYLITITGSGNTCSALDITITDSTNTYSTLYDNTIGTTSGTSDGKGANRNMIVELSEGSTVEMTITTRGYGSQFMVITKL